MRFLLGIADVARWPFERLAWLFERRVLWPLRERSAGWSPPGHVAGAAALGAVAVAAVLVGALALSGGSSTPTPSAEQARVAIVPSPAPAPAEETAEPALKGIAPSFGVSLGSSVAEPAEEEPAEAEALPEGEANGEAEAPGEDGAAAATSSKKPVPAGPEAMKVARRFAEAFVFYEIGERPARAKTVFGETTTPELATALTERPPRQPEAAEVPQAKVMNLVPGPRAGKAYTVSVSLLRVGLTSELRLEMQKENGAWLVTDVRG